ncbi:MAG: glycosyltransferase [Okeania sp. SIO2G4]|uniref:glycosyltransferase family 4 protein n=1 Tax=unclassified Okeania TaxID=2634635 RepID=UPI0013BE58DD|nr:MULTISPECIES: glycosyltransferase family 4 protein [unclassified Okeania]NEP03879.1 glycosyltransferase [Okeania sp. SIO4D6]NEP72311.1 glycosyltransferase [Okeania sp. SIO2G5]NEP94278.1 glycosyltransferase [Okeania sp. SIO2F5]NEQ90991.1 glycosyltransferase [Okeania sp. SIO2G4]
MQILMLSSTFPYPPSRGGTQVRTFNLLKYLSQKHSVTLLTQLSPDVNDSEIDSLRSYVEELAVFPRPQEPTKGTLVKLRRFSNFLIEGTPPSVLSIYSPTMQNWVDEFVAAGKCEAITCEHCVNEIYIRPQWQQQLKTLVNVHSSVYGTCKQQLETGTAEKPLRDRLNLPLLLRYEKRYCSKFSCIVATTEEDGKQLQEFNPNSQISVIPNGVDFTQFPYRSNDPGGHQLIFVGAMDNFPNIDAVRFLTLEILPKVQERYPDTTLALVGARPVPEVQELSTRPGVKVTGRVPSMAEYLHQATVCVIPMRTGFGIKNKTLEAMAAGTPVVASDRGLEGLAVDGANTPLKALRANQVAEYVEAISRLFEDGQLRQTLSENGRSLIETEYTWEVQGQRYEQVLLG